MSQTDPFCPSVLRRRWLGCVAYKIVPRNDVISVVWDIKPYSLTRTYPLDGV